MSDLEINDVFREKVREIKKVRYICTIPRSGIQSIKCYPDAKIFLHAGKKFGYSKSRKTLLVTNAPTEAWAKDVSNRSCILKFIRAIR